MATYTATEAIIEYNRSLNHRQNINPEYIMSISYQILIDICLLIKQSAQKGIKRTKYKCPFILHPNEISDIGKKLSNNGFKWAIKGNYLIQSNKPPVFYITF